MHQRSRVITLPCFAYFFVVLHCNKKAGNIYIHHYGLSCHCVSFDIFTEAAGEHGNIAYSYICLLYILHHEEILR
jgi:hypothetical protein